MLSGRGLCDELITRPEESWRLWCVVVCDLENLVNEEAITRVGSQRHSKKKKTFYIANVFDANFKDFECLILRTGIIRINVGMPYLLSSEQRQNGNQKS